MILTHAHSFFAHIHTLLHFGLACLVHLIFYSAIVFCCHARHAAIHHFLFVHGAILRIVRKCMHTGEQDHGSEQNCS